jgi:hypothetical protein
MRSRYSIEIDWSDCCKKLALMEDAVNDAR